MSEINKIFVTNATNNVNSWIISRLLQEGFHVIAAFHPTKSQTATEIYASKIQDYKDHFSLYPTDYSDIQNLIQILKPCDTVIYTPIFNPYKIKKANAIEIIEQSLNDLKNLINAVTASSSIDRVIGNFTIANYLIFDRDPKKLNFDISKPIEITNTTGQEFLFLHSEAENIIKNAYAQQHF